ncbi:hypothetical protein EHS25_007317 [Saitozyma podzolica]|uniref:Major facilitator superfamily (MFS) profile domain-containing protein n=1 Tax=Saitozyma podzolica TaxID=1890683 RepID=A0A427XML0_9TREE|nr:hypothetical protein EHS25_007317 [Saitozyma podzolica]
MSLPITDIKDNVEHLDQPSLNDVAFTPGSVEEKRLVRKIDRRILPILWLMYILNYLDRTNIGNAKTGGMQADLKLSSSDYSLVLSIFFVGYLLNEVPCNMILSRTRPSLFLPTIMFCWGAMSIGAKGVNSLGGMVAFRFFLGIIEAGFFPGVMLLLSCWYKPAELSKRVAFFYTASLMSGAFGGLLAGGIITGLEGVAGTRGWKCTTRWLSEDERRLAVDRLVVASLEAAVAEEADISHMQAFKLAVKNPRTWAFLITYNMLNSVGTISYFFPTLMTSLGYTGQKSQFMTVPIYAVALVIALAVGFSADKTGQKAYHGIGACLLGVVSFVICATVSNNAVRYTFICFGGAGIWSCIPILLSWLVTMFEGRESRAISIALINGFGNLSSVYGSFFWPSDQAPQYHMGFAITTALLGATGVAIGLIKYFYGDRGVQKTN